MRIKIVFTGKTQNTNIKSIVDDYILRINRYAKCSVIEIPDVKNRGKISINELRKAESEKILSKISEKDEIILLDEKGKNFNSVEFADFINKYNMRANIQPVFIVGGAWGFDDKLIKKAKLKISLSKMTFSHQIVRVLFAEQLYRAFTIIRNEPYHNQ